MEYTKENLEAVRDIIIDLYKEKGRAIYYSELSEVLEAKGTPLHHRSPKMPELLEAISIHEEKNNRGMFSVMVVAKKSRVSGEGFFTLAQQLGRDFEDPKTFAEEERKRVSAIWGLV
ncbi:hypothetical protein [Terribacillus sp. DMT04]|jgi:hypothetical protein|uniref:hypothetical protein n=1 Tax=Terribacillus sp. DMT04 TaxID=2850441 RepID=UPI001C2BD507|nr:hypothetical protein [Terribacillus sp. DMT04]QXE03194.1 hypothetical protein KS242_08505 [Terribacillus sp. DMT04]